MKRKKEERIDSVLGVFLHENGLETPLLQYRLLQSWTGVVEDSVAQHTEVLRIQGGVLIVRVDSPSLSAELQMHRAWLVNQLNAAVGAQIISDIRFVLGVR